MNSAVSRGDFLSVSLVGSPGNVVQNASRSDSGKEYQYAGNENKLDTAWIAALRSECGPTTA